MKLESGNFAIEVRMNRIIFMRIGVSVPAAIPKPQHKRPANLTIDPDRLRFGQKYAEVNQTSLSRVVEELLGALEQAFGPKPEPTVKDPLDGLLLGWPSVEKKDLRHAQHEARLAR